MKIMLSCGNNTKKIINTISKLADGIDYTFNKNVKDFIKDSKLRKATFKRLVFSDTFLSKNPSSDFHQLGDFLKEFADGTEVVLILKGQNPVIEEAFLEVFNSPLYSIAYMPKPTPNSLIDLVKATMPTVKARYYELDKGKGSKSTDGSEETPEIKEVSIPAINNYQGSNNSGESISENAINPYSSNAGNQPINCGINDVDRNGATNEYSKNSAFSEDDSYSGGQNNYSSENYNDDSDDLSVGEFGAAHDDTGMFDDEDDNNLKELEQHAAAMAKQEQAKQQEETHPIQSIEDDKQEDDFSDSYVQVEESIEEDEVPNIKEEVIPVQIKPEHKVVNPQPRVVKPQVKNKVALVTGLNGSGATQWIIDMAADGISRGMSVLVIDLDYYTNGLLSFIDSTAFYAQGCQNNKIYEEDGVHFLSMGYGTTLTPDFLGVLTDREFLESYNAVFIDCPVECLDCIPVEVLDSVETYICSLSDISKIIELSGKLTSRDYTDIKTEIALMSPNKAIYTDCKKVSQEDIEYVKSILFMPNGYWFA